MRYLIKLSLLVLFTPTTLQTNAQSAIYINQPLGMLSKIRLTYETSIDSNYSLLINYTNFYGLVDGHQGLIELRKYNIKHTKNLNFFKYLRGGVGKSTGTEGLYGIIGLGVGERITFGKRVFLACRQGVKYIQGNGNYDTAPNPFKGFFYISGPGAVVDLNFDIGYTF